MNCILGPYQITSDLLRLATNQQLDGFAAFICPSESFRTISIGCSESHLPTADAVTIHTIEDCPSCKMIWYECPSKMGRIYTLLITPCSVTITSFENGLAKSNSCNALSYGSVEFCFGKNYSSTGVLGIEINVTSFDFEGHHFSISGSSSICDELYDCSNCQSVASFAEMPSAPDHNLIETPQISILPDRPSIPIEEEKIPWAWDLAHPPIGIDTLCETEKSLLSWNQSSLKECESIQHPSVASLPSGHTIIAYESRDATGSTKISAAILASSVSQNIRYYRQQSRGTLLNNLVESKGVATFDVFDDMLISVNSQSAPTQEEKIGFLTGPLARPEFFTITKITRLIEASRVKIRFNFLVDPKNVTFENKIMFMTFSGFF